ncbi:MAG: amylo-alpha-1,6-glucosidase [Melioribacteraceae bacterium]
MKTKFIVSFFFTAFFSLQIFSQEKIFEKINYKGDAKIEVGSFYVGSEFHHSCPVPQRFSFYYPVANSIDLSKDFWYRDTTYVMNIGLKFGDEYQWLNNQTFQIELTPYSVKFYKTEDEKSIEIYYQFTKSNPAIVISYSIKNNTNETKEVELFTRLSLALRTSHTYELKKSIKTISKNDGAAIFVDNLARETQNTQLFILNVVEKPVDFIINKSLIDKINFQMYSSYKNLIEEPTSNFLYRKKIKPREKFIVKQIIGTCKVNESEELAGYLMKNYHKEINDFENFILSRVSKNDIIKSGDNWIDKTVKWSNAILEVNKHYIDGQIEPMPCPAEYNFYFTHDVLMTDFAAVKFNLDRVRKNFEFIIKHANQDKIIPHAYYWKDSAFVTEYADFDNWNNLWFIIVAAEYLKYSQDKKFIEQIYPYLEQSLSNALKTKGDDDLIWSYRPDWWDIGKLYGPRSYMTILTIKAIRAFIFISAFIEKNENKLLEYEVLSDKIEKSLNEKLWIEKFHYLMNYLKPDSIDVHYYSGSLLASHFNVIDSSKILGMINTAEKFLLDKNTGVYTVNPMDFSELKDLWQFAGNEAGDKFYYLNGGIWFHSNAWYALALISADNREKAFSFIKNNMTIDGIMKGPNGQPAMYEVRNGDYNDSKVYGTIDKPQFLWAAGWYLYTLYHLFGINYNEWNIEFNPYLLPNQKECVLNLNVSGHLSKVRIMRDKVYRNKINDKEIYSFVLPQKLSNVREITFSKGAIQNSYLKTTNSILDDINVSNNKMKIFLKAFKGHKNKTTIITNRIPKEILLSPDRKVDYLIRKINDGWIIDINFVHQHKIEELTIKL